MLERQVSGAHTWRCPWQAAVCMEATRQCLFSLQKKKKSFQSGLPGVHQQTGAGKAVALLSATRQLYAREAWGARSHVILTLQLK
jgi:hypothetical protein